MNQVAEQAADTVEPSSSVPRTVPDIMAAARQLAGLDDFGEPAFIKGMSRLVEGFRVEAQLSPLGEQLAYGGIINMLVNRLRYVRDVKAHPEILRERIDRPIVILGLPRTGTTKLQRVLSTSPQALPMLYWRMMNPAPFPDEQPGHPVARIQAARDAVSMLTAQFPGFVARHPTEAEVPDEEVLLMQGSFQCVVTWLFARMPSFYDFAMNTDPRPLYDYLHSQLQYMQWQQGGARGRSWVMKSPCHTGFVDTLLAVFPDAVLVHCHRDVQKVLPSMAGLTEEMRRVHSDRVDRLVIGQEMLDYFGGMMDRYLELRAALPPGRILDVRYQDIIEDLPQVIRRIHQQAGRTLDAETLKNAARFEEERPQHYLGTYTYELADYGLTTAMIAGRFAGYQQRFAAFA
jgi:hypothetical protein